MPSINACSRPESAHAELIRKWSVRRGPNGRQSGGEGRSAQPHAALARQHSGRAASGSSSATHCSSPLGCTYLTIAPGLSSTDVNFQRLTMGESFTIVGTILCEFA